MNMDERKKEVENMISYVDSLKCSEDDKRKIGYCFHSRMVSKYKKEKTQPQEEVKTIQG